MNRELLFRGKRTDNEGCNGVREKLIELIGDCKWWGKIEDMADYFIANGVTIKTEESMTIGESIRKHRKDLGVNTLELSRETGVCRESISQWENDVYLPNILSLWSIADFLGLEIDVLIGRNYPVKSKGNEGALEHSREEKGLVLTLGQCLKKHREALGLNRTQVSKKTGYVPETISRWEEGKTMPKLDAILVLADEYGVSIDQLIGRNQGEING